MINSLPVEAHLPGGYQHASPRTHLDFRLEKNIKPLNKLDELALNHDLAYARSNDLSKRHEADYVLQEGGVE